MGIPSTFSSAFPPVATVETMEGEFPFARKTLHAFQTAVSVPPHSPKLNLRTTLAIFICIFSLILPIIKLLFSAEGKIFFSAQKNLAPFYSTVQ